ncbi:ATP12 family chaperone protein [Parerythrobacter jejuensis]|uniref:Molecular chaperone n=1 Tax=Parerythrobacter jejuensis TaxID=795812 RepID=A0A845ASR9_9SPHN|nr:ATP12 family protein [Parerythrobacter jejuensis]MXP31556.1 molecular chaperone [Parerythrobacter jejuensis]
MKRFWKDVRVEQLADGWQVALDGRPLKTQGKREQIVPSEALAQALAAEWDRQGDTVDPASLPGRDMADFAIDRIATGEEDVISKLLAFGETDTLCYRAEPGEAVFRRQEEVWEPLVRATEQREGIRLERISGIIHRPQPDASIAALRKRLAEQDAFILAPLLTLSSLSASLCIGLAALQPSADTKALWDAANLEEDWQAELWGEDAEAAEVRARRTADFERAMEFLDLVRNRVS